MEVPYGQPIVGMAVKRGVTPVSYTHLDVYKRQEQEWGLSLIMDEARKGAAAGGPFWAIGN